MKRHDGYDSNPLVNIYVDSRYGKPVRPKDVRDGERNLITLENNKFLKETCTVMGCGKDAVAEGAEEAEEKQREKRLNFRLGEMKEVEERTKKAAAAAVAAAKTMEERMEEEVEEANEGGGGGGAEKGGGVKSGSGRGGGGGEEAGGENAIFTFLQRHSNAERPHANLDSDIREKSAQFVSLMCRASGDRLGERGMAARGAVVIFVAVMVKWRYCCWIHWCCK
ncbi:hypothetical protein E2C01_044490 [Portunus trituberculatus]|uniref:Uncharacterized protein n=1 Tax=Portunus trituberculatus TaxID=210409 RepID=A0A5B7FSB5_PORTR|nr:hypothetical protein [Portunus trituberculatus]